MGTAVSIKQFYSGGAEQLQVVVSHEQLDVICRMIRSQFYQRSIREGLNGVELESRHEPTQRTQNSTVKQSSSYIPTDEKRGKTVHRGKDGQPQESVEAIIKRRIMESRESNYQFS